MIKNIHVFLPVLALVLISGSCRNNKDDDPVPVIPTPTNPSGLLDNLYNPIDPSIASSVGFFLDDWQPKMFVVPSSSNAGTVPGGDPTDTINVDLNKVVAKVPKYIFGNNANQWMGQIVDQTGLMGYLKDLNTNVLRFPGGSISDLYFWNAPVNSPPADVATTIYNSDGSAKTMTAADWWYGTRTNNEDWTISLDNYYKLLQQTNSTGMITVNYGYARYGKGTDPVATAAHLAADWVRHDKGI